MTYKDRLFVQIENNIEPDCEDFYLYEIKKKEQKYNKLISNLKKEKGDIKETIEMLSDTNSCRIPYLQNKYKTFEEILSKIEKEQI